MDANTKRTLTAALRAAKSFNAAGDKLASTTAEFVKAAGGFDQALKVLNARRGKESTWKAEREANTPIWRVYNAVSAAKSRDKPKAKRKARQTTGKDATGKDATGKDATGKDATGKDATGKAVTPASDADVLAVVLSWGAERIAQAVNDQTAVLTASAVDVLTATIGLLIDQPTAPRAPAKRAPRKRAK